MSTNQIVKKNPAGLYVIGILSLAVPALVALMYLKPNLGFFGFDVSAIPHINAVLNSGTALLLLTGYYFVKNDYKRQHVYSMIAAFTLSSVFLVLYVIYHSSAGHTYFGDADGNGILTDLEKAEVSVIRIIYSVILLTHIVLAAIIVPFVLSSIYFGWQKDFSRHRKISKWTFPLWFYVSVSGVVVYFMISPYYR